MVTFFHWLFPNVFPAMGELPAGIGGLIICLEFYAFAFGPYLWKRHYTHSISRVED